MTNQRHTPPPSQPIYLPLAGGCRRIELICNATAQQDGLVRAYFIGAPGHGPEMIDSAERAAHAVYGILRQYGIQLPDKCMAGFHLLEQEGKTPATLCGESGGLAFAIAFASGLLGPPPCPVAATGRIIECTANAQVESVMAVEEKIRAAAPLLGAGSLFFLPMACRDALSPELARKMQQQSVEIIFVTTLAEAISRLWPNALKQKNKDGRSPLPQAMSDQSMLPPFIVRGSGLLQHFTRITGRKTWLAAGLLAGLVLLVGLLMAHHITGKRTETNTENVIHSAKKLQPAHDRPSPRPAQQPDNRETGFD